MSDILIKQKEVLCLLRLINVAMDMPSFINGDFFKVIFKVLIRPKKDEIIKDIEEYKCLYKEYDEIDEQLDEERREQKNLLGEIIENKDLFLKKIDEYEEREKVEELKNAIKKVLKYLDKRKKIRKF